MGKTNQNMNRGLMIIALFLAVGVGMYYYLQPAGGASASDAVYDITVQNRRMEPPILNVAEGSSIKLEVRTDEEGVFRIDGFGVSETMAIGRAVELDMTASTPGTYPITMYPASAPRQKIQVGTLEVKGSNRAW